MKPAPFNYVRPASLDDALQLLSRHAGEARVLAGGQSLVAMMNLRFARPDLVIDIQGLPDLDRHWRDGDLLRIGALVRHATLAASPLVRQLAPLMSDAYPHVAHRTVRNQGTLAGNLCHADPASEMPAVLLALDGQLRLCSVRGERIVAAADFFLGPYTTAAEPDELLVEVLLPVRRTGHGFEEVSIRQGDFALTLVAATLGVASGRIASASLAYAGVGPHALRCAAAERALLGQSPSEALFQQAAEAAAGAITPGSDQHADAAYRLDLIRTLTQRALRRAASTANTTA